MGDFLFGLSAMRPRQNETGTNAPMPWANFLHIYQPAHQAPDILQRVVNESYLPLVRDLLKNPHARLTLNINAVLSELLVRHEHFEIIEGLKQLAARGQLEFTESAKYHPLLPLIPKDEIRRQIELNRATNQKIFGGAYQPVGFFPPEMGFSNDIAEIVAKLGYEWIIIDEIAAFGKVEALSYNGYYAHPSFPQLKLFFRERRPSNLIMSAVVRSAEAFLETLDSASERYLLTAMDGETFGHHRPGHEKFLLDLFHSNRFRLVTISDIPALFSNLGACDPKASTWASTERDIAQNIQFRSWKDPENAIHALQWEFLQFVYERVKQCGREEPCAAAREKMDEAFASDHLWWASGKPWWSIEMIEVGAFRLLDTLKSLPKISDGDVQDGERFYHHIVGTAFAWQRTGFIRRLAERYRETARIPFKERTLESGKPEVYRTFLEFMKQKMKEAAEKQEYEKSILWRDAIWKLETKNDIYDAIHATDLLRAEIPDWQLRELMDRYREEYRRMKPGQPEHRE